MNLSPSPELTYEEIVGTPEELLADATWQPIQNHPLKQLTAFCLPGWHTERVGEKFRFADEQIRLDETRTTTEWDWRSHPSRRDFRYALVLRCGTCDRDTRMSAKGWAWAS